MCMILLFFFFVFFFGGGGGGGGVLHINLKWPPKFAGKRFLKKAAGKLCRYPGDQKYFC